ncbi:hypothetical protein V6Z12_A04G008300 [Gossypium hirsutum]
MRSWLGRNSLDSGFFLLLFFCHPYPKLGDEYEIYQVTLRLCQSFRHPKFCFSSDHRKLTFCLRYSFFVRTVWYKWGDEIKLIGLSIES